jgi:hypothetical protein
MPKGIRDQPASEAAETGSAHVNSTGAIRAQPSTALRIADHESRVLSCRDPLATGSHGG